MPKSLSDVIDERVDEYLAILREKRKENFAMVMLGLTVAGIIVLGLWKLVEILQGTY